MNIQPVVIIFSTDRANVPFSVNDAARREAVEKLDSVKAMYDTGEGVYNGAKEKNFIVVLPSIATHKGQRVMQAIKELCKTHLQECYLLIDANGYATSEQVETGKSVPVGTLKEVSREYAEAKESYTVLDGKYYRAE